ncbi:MAG: hypothetical protein L6R38_008162 [Xanthoria sp. 2 TBL-2021]|nr:MAG: hypothetical protein L6R38_008162 [Xanthoria sp. 2 TBL-2021]
MDWDSRSGFDGEGTYVIINKASLFSLELDDCGGLSVNPHTPNNPAQLWEIHKWSSGDIYVIKNLNEKELVVVQGG